MFKKYKTWWVISFAVFAYFFANLVMFAMIGLSLARPASLEQGAAQFVLMFITFFSTLIPYYEQAHLK